jgi:protein-S-isoprenylcysteine O-methyltransferase Ste14
MSCQDATGNSEATVPSDQVFKLRGWIGALILLPAIGVACLSPPLWNEGTLADSAVDALGWCLLAVGLFLRLWATLYIGGKKSLSFVAEGPYAMCRHPLYLGSFFIILALPVFLQSPILLAAVVLVTILHVALVLPSEERHLAQSFGDVYRAYAQQTPSILPRLRNLRRPGVIEIKVAELLREAGRAFGCGVIGAASEVVIQCRAQSWWPVLHFP